jgi:PAS domain S-box-containing protein
MTENRLSPSPSSPITVLHVDDDPAFVETTATFIEHEDDRMSVRTATSANEGMEQLSDEIDCVVSDYEMPNKTGIEFLETLRDTHPDLPFILFTGRGSEAVASQAISAGVTDYLQKETSTEQYELLCNRIENLVDRHRKAKRLEQTQRRFEKVFEQSNDGILIIDPYSEEIRNVNPRACELLCYERDELLSMSPEEIHPHQLDRFRKFVDEVYDEGQGWTEELSCYKKDGETIRAHISASTITVEDNRYMLAIIREMGTWSMHSGNRELVRTLLDYSSEGIYIIDPETGQFVDVNQTACHRLGYDRQELVSMAVPDIDGSGIINDWEDHVERVVTADWTSEGMSHLRKDGTTYPVELSVRNIARGDDQHYLVAVARDISDN